MCPSRRPSPRGITLTVHFSNLAIVNKMHCHRNPQEDRARRGVGYGYANGEPQSVSPADASLASEAGRAIASRSNATCMASSANLIAAMAIRMFGNLRERSALSDGSEVADWRSE